MTYVKTGGGGICGGGIVVNDEEIGFKKTCKVNARRPSASLTSYVD